ncbi:phage major capsid protein [Propylenella binzhouense]|uniref:phage major capsid protein n=1 Tax=Propylenella binzhouense TaxID=2555902 RepID=UPI00136C5FCF
MKAAISIPRVADAAGLTLWAKAAALAAVGHEDTADVAARIGAPDSVQRAIRSGVAARVDHAIKSSAMHTGDPTAAGLTDVRTISTTFAASLRNASIFFSLLESGAMIRLPLETRLSATTARATAFLAGEGAAVPVRKLEVEGDLIDLQKAAGIIVLTKELVRSGGSAAEAFITRELRRAVSATTDEGFLSTVTDSGTPSIPSSGTDAAAATEDIRALVTAVGLTVDSRPVFGLAPDVARQAALLSWTSGIKTFPDFDLTGGTILGVPAIVSDALASGTIALFDGQRLGGDLEAITVTASGDTTVAMAAEPTMDATTPAATDVISLFQTNSVGALVTIWFGVRRLDDTAVAMVTDVSWGETVGSGS